MDERKDSKLRERLGVTAILTGALALAGLIVWLAVVAGYEGTKKIRAWANAPEPKAHMPNDASKENLFQHRLECSKFLEKREADRRPQKGVLPLGVVVFYSPTTNTCLYLDRFIVQGRTVVPPIHDYRVEFASVEDLLTGRSLETHEFDLTIPTQSDAAKGFEEAALKRYGYYADGK